MYKDRLRGRSWEGGVPYIYITPFVVVNETAIRKDEEAEARSAERGARHAAKEADRAITNFPQPCRPDLGLKLCLLTYGVGLGGLPHRLERPEFIRLLCELRKVAKSASHLVAEYSFSRRARCSLPLTGSVLPGILAVLS